MNFTCKITSVRTIHEIEGYWTPADYNALLEEFNFSDTENSSPSELRELIEMGISDFEPHEAAEILLRYKLKEHLNKGQILNLSHEMLEDNESEEYPDIAMHYPMFNINQLLYKSYNGVFPNAKATKLEFELNFKGGEKLPFTKELVLRAICRGLSDKNLIIRLYKDQIEREDPFPEAESIIWELHNHGEGKFTLITSDYWINDEDIPDYDFSASILQQEN